MDSSILKPAAELARANKTRHSERERRISSRPRGAAGRGDRAAPPHRARRGAAPRAAAGRRGDEGTTRSRARTARSPCRTCSATSRRSSSTATCSARSASGRARCAPRFWAHGTAKLPTSSSASRSRSSRARRSSGWSRSRRSAAGHRLKIYSRSIGRLHARLRQLRPTATMPGFNVFTRRDGAIRHFWCGEMGRRDRRSRPGSARRARSDAALDHPRHHARRPRHGLVSEAGILRRDGAKARLHLMQGDARSRIKTKQFLVLEKSLRNPRTITE